MASSYDEIKDFVNDLSEEQAIIAFHDMSNKFGWSGTFFTKADAESAWENIKYDDPEQPMEDIPESVWENIRRSWLWRKGLPERLTEIGWDMMYDDFSMNKDVVNG